MRFAALLLVVIVAICASDAAIFKTQEYTSFFAKFVKQYKRAFSAGSLFNSKFNIFKSNLDKITLANAKQNAGWKINDLADMSHSQFVASLGLKAPESTYLAMTGRGRNSREALAFLELGAPTNDAVASFVEIAAPNNKRKKKEAERKQKEAEEKKKKDDAMIDDMSIPDTALSSAQRLERQRRRTERARQELADKKAAEEKAKAERARLVAEFEKTPFDWRDKGVVGAVKHQRSCGSCWAFATIGAIESAIAIKHKISPPNLSEQHLVDCDTTNSGCQGGWYTRSFRFAQQGTYETSVYGPYVQAKRECATTGKTAYKHGFKGVVEATGYKVDPKQYDTDLMAALMHGPVAIAVRADPSLQFWGSKTVFTANCISQVVDHAVVLIGHKKDDDGNPVWIIRNSWGETWGRGDGTYYMIRDPGANTCGIHTGAFLPVFE